MSRTPTGNVRINCFVPPKHAEIMKKLAKKEGIPFSDIVREGIKREIVRRAAIHKAEKDSLKV